MSERVNGDGGDGGDDDRVQMVGRCCRPLYVCLSPSNPGEPMHNTHTTTRVEVENAGSPRRETEQLTSYSGWRHTTRGAAKYEEPTH